MEVERRDGEANVLYDVRDIQGDMGEPTRMRLIQQADGDVIVSIFNARRGVVLSIEFCTGTGGGKEPEFTAKLREAIAVLVATHDP